LRRRIDELVAAASEAEAFFRDDPLKQAGLVEPAALPIGLATAIKVRPAKRSSIDAQDFAPMVLG
jgi:hypothetical protein